ncbi:MAG: NADH-quinone oxidoreductase subunit NuoN [Hyphomicrobiales bacterium]|nr:NADH-quinone oxidoreductase subunit NuoN [Hyphomicrobiales bacterium]MBV9432140.1 NADH-quinone oxidoreductase subunit NuoN [Hyphomicrobiales bacterium]MBV9739411.1 NADH-quinone oxidoreductase subunit NuoN [Hyphomicrobiales bacterium]
MMATALPSILTILPELVLATGALFLILTGAFQGTRSINLVNGAAFAILVVATIAAVFQTSETQTAFNGSFVVDDFARFMKVVTLLGAAATLALAIDEMSRQLQKPFELAILVLLSSLGMLLMISANDLIALYLGLELSSLALYVLAAIDRHNAKASEAGLKYFVLGALSSGMLLYGASLIYGFTGTVSFAGIAAAVKGGSGSGLMFGLVFLLAGLAFKISAVPFHMWTPDVYEGAPTPVTAYFAATNKIAAMALTTRVLIQAFGTDAAEWRQILVFISIASMGLGAFAAIGQRNIKRLMAYSSISHVGYALVGLSAGTQDGVNGVLVYMAIYMAMTVGTFGCIVAMRTKDGSVETIDDLSGLARSQPAFAFVLMVLMFSLAGVPPLAGFWAKWYVFSAAVDAGLVPLAVIGFLTSVVGAYYYLRIVRVMYFDDGPARFVPLSGVLRAVLAVCGIVVILFGLLPSPIVMAAGAAAKSLF